MLNVSHNKNVNIFNIMLETIFIIIQNFFYISSNNFSNFLKKLKLFNPILLKKLFYFKEYIYQIFFEIYQILSGIIFLLVIINFEYLNI